MTDFSWQPEDPEHYQRGLTSDIHDTLFQKGLPSEDALPALREQYQGILVRHMTARLVTSAIELGLSPGDFDEWVHDLHAGSVESNNGAESDAELALEEASLKSSEVNNGGLESQIRYLMSKGINPGTLMQNIGIMAYENFDDDQGADAPMAAVVAAVIESCDGNPLADFNDREEFIEWFDASFHYDAMDASEGEVQPTDPLVVKAVHLYLRGRELGGVLDVEDSKPAPAMSM